jgi:hypothetical protein
MSSCIELSKIHGLFVDACPQAGSVTPIRRGHDNYVLDVVLLQCPASESRRHARFFHQQSHGDSHWLVAPVCTVRIGLDLHAPVSLLVGGGWRLTFQSASRL